MECYDSEYLLKMTNIDEIQKYITTYFKKVIEPNCLILYYKNKKYTKRTEQELKSILPKKLDVIHNKTFFKPFDWFIDYSPNYELIHDPNLPKFIPKTNNSIAKINDCEELPYSYAKNNNYNDYPIDIKNKVETILKHILEVLCSDNKDLYDYVIKWFAFVCTGTRKVISSLFLKSMEGTGKSILMSLFRKIVGMSLSSSLCNVEQLTGFNYDLCNKFLVIFEELPCLSKGEWQSSINVLKDLITNPDMISKRKYEKNEPAFTPYGIIIISNNEVLKMGINSRRYCCLDISNKYVETPNYFTELGDIISNNNVIEAFYIYLLNIVKQNMNWKEYPVIQTQQKTDNQVANMNHEFEYIKTHYIKLQKDLIVSVSQLHEDYAMWANMNKYKVLHKVEFANSLKDIGLIKRKNSTYNGKYIYNYTHEQLYKIFTNKKMIHELDEIEDVNNNNNISSSDDEAIINKLNTLSKHKLHKLYNIIKNKIDEPIIIPKTDNFIDDIDNKIIVENNILDDGEILISHDKCNNNMLKVKHILNNFEKNKIFKIKK